MWLKVSLGDLVCLFNVVKQIAFRCSLAIYHRTALEACTAQVGKVVVAKACFNQSLWFHHLQQVLFLRGKYLRVPCLKLLLCLLFQSHSTPLILSVGNAG